MLATTDAIAHTSISMAVLHQMTAALRHTPTEYSTNPPPCRRSASATRHPRLRKIDCLDHSLRQSQARSPLSVRAPPAPPRLSSAIDTPHTSSCGPTIGPSRGRTRLTSGWQMRRSGNMPSRRRGGDWIAWRRCGGRLCKSSGPRWISGNLGVCRLRRPLGTGAVG